MMRLILFEIYGDYSRYFLIANAVCYSNTSPQAQKSQSHLSILRVHQEYIIDTCCESLTLSPL